LNGAIKLITKNFRKAEEGIWYSNNILRIFEVNFVRMFHDINAMENGICNNQRIMMENDRNGFIIIRKVFENMKKGFMGITMKYDGGVEEIKVQIKETEMNMNVSLNKAMEIWGKMNLDTNCNILKGFIDVENMLENININWNKIIKWQLEENEKVISEQYNEEKIFITQMAKESCEKLMEEINLNEIKMEFNIDEIKLKSGNLEKTIETLSNKIEEDSRENREWKTKNDETYKETTLEHHKIMVEGFNGINDILGFAIVKTGEVISVLNNTMKNTEEKQIEIWKKSMGELMRHTKKQRILDLK
jgi:hypothetical protein